MKRKLLTVILAMVVGLTFVAPSANAKVIIVKHRRHHRHRHHRHHRHHVIEWKKLN